MRIFVAGDSWVAGRAGSALAEHLRRAGHTVEVLGIVGAGARRLAADARLRATLRLFRPQVVVLVLGVNDGAPTTPAAARQVAANYRALFTLIERAGARVVFVPTPAVVEPFASAMRALRAVVEDVAAEALVDATDLVEAGDFDRSRYHLRPQAAALWGRAVAERLLEQGIGATRQVFDTVGTSLLRLLPLP